jgi:hypothetical protein
MSALGQKRTRWLIVSSGAEDASYVCVDNNYDAIDVRRRQRNCLHGQ